MDIEASKTHNSYSTGDKSAVRAYLLWTSPENTLHEDITTDKTVSSLRKTVSEDLAKVMKISDGGRTNDIASIESMGAHVEMHLERLYGMKWAQIEKFTDFTKYKFTRDHYTIHHAWKKYFLKISGKSDERLIKNEANISKSFNAHYFVNCPKIIDSVEGQPYTEFNGKIAVLYSFVESQNLWTKMADNGSIHPKVNRKTYASVAMLHANLSENEWKIPSLDTKKISIPETLTVIKEIKPRIQEQIATWNDIEKRKFHLAYLEYIEHELPQLKSVADEIEKNIPKQLIHGDLDGQNIVLHDGKTMFLDWETAKVYYRVYDLMRSIHFCYSPPTTWSQAIDIDKIVETVRTYHQLEKLTDSEIRYFMDVYYLDWITNIQPFSDIYLKGGNYSENMLQENFGIITWLKEHKETITSQLTNNLSTKKSM